ncbi:MAG: mandelate racemase [Betaproteobacteria bacterium]|nr:mandelate racemase [Betaproteobacteria bacterium]
MNAPRFRVAELELYERPVRLRLPFRFGAATLRAAQQAFVRARIRLAGGREAHGAAAELLAPKWFDKDPALSDEDNANQLRSSLALAREGYLAGGANTAFGHFRAHYAEQIKAAAGRGLNALVANYGPALVDRALLDALCRAHGLSFYAALRANLPGIELSGWLAELARFDMSAFLASLEPQPAIAARHTVGLADPLVAADQPARVNDGLPETLEEVIARYGNRHFKLKLSGELAADVERLAAIAAVLERIDGRYQVTLDGNEQYEDVEGVLALWRRLAAERRLRRLAASVLYVEQPIKRQAALAQRVSKLAAEVPVIIDESDDSLEAFARARTLGYAGVSSKSCKGVYRSLINRARCELWNRAARDARYFVAGEDLTVQAGLALQQDLALASLLGLEHVERNGHHYVNGMAGLPDAEQAAFHMAHPDLYENSHGAVRVAIRDGLLAIGSLDCAGFASRAMPDWRVTRRVRYGD